MATLTLAAIFHGGSLVAAEIDNGSTQNDTTGSHLGWVSAPPRRDTMSVIWSCVSILLVCTYKCVHFNISSFKENRAGWHRTKRFGVPYWPETPLLRKYVRKINCMLFILLAPELGVAIAAEQYQEARRVLQEAQDSFPDEQLSLIHAFYANMGGFAAEVPRMDIHESPYLIGLDLKQYLSVVVAGSSGVVTAESLYDRSKSDAFTKAFAIVQCAWLLTQTIARVSMGFRITELELATLAYVLCAIIMYGLWWHKPFNVEHVTIVTKAERNFSLLELNTLWKRVENAFGYFMGAELDTKQQIISSTLFYGTAVLFSAVHLAAWNWDFGNAVMKTAWRIFALSATSLPFVLFGLITSNRDTGPFKRIYAWAIIFCAVAYAAARILLLLLVLSCFKSMPAAAYEGINWAMFLPHFS